MGMLIKQIILGCIILMFVDEISYAHKLLRKTTPIQRATRRVMRLNTPARVRWAYRMSQYNCHLHKSCSPGGPKACAWDELWNFLAIFRDICAMYMFNCQSKGRYSYVIQTNAVCRLKKDFVDQGKPIKESDLPQEPSTTDVHEHVNKTTHWWWQGCTTDRYRYLQSLEVVTRHLI